MSRAVLPSAVAVVLDGAVMRSPRAGRAPGLPLGDPLPGSGLKRGSYITGAGLPGLQGQPRPHPLRDGALQDERRGRHVVERDPETHAEEALAVVTAAVLEAGDDLAEVGEHPRDALEVDTALSRVQELRRVVGVEALGGGHRLG